VQHRLKSKKFSLALTLIFLCSIVFGAMPVQPAYAQFSDIKGNWAEWQINDWVDRGLAGGYTDGTFRPNNQITRAEFVALTNRAFGKKDKTVRVDFKDVKDSDWFYAEVAMASAEGYCAGYTDGTFRPLNPITRHEVASIVTRLLELGAGAADKNYADAESIAPWARDAVNAVSTAGIMSGYTDGTFKGTNPITRAEAVVTLDRASNTTRTPPVISEGIMGSITMDGKVMEGAVVLLFAENGIEPINETTSGRDGKYAFQVDAGTYDITAAKDKFVAYAANVSFTGDGVVQDLALAEGTLISGRLVDKNGSAVKNAKLFFTTNPTFLTSTDGSGDFKVYVPAGKKYKVRGYKNNKPTSGLEILLDNIEAETAGSQSIGTIRTTYALVTSSGGGGGGISTGTAATPTASPASGAVQAGTEVVLSTNTTGATIRYTTDGSEPTTTSTQYSSPITITEAVTIKAKALKSGWNASSTATFSYTVISEAVPVTAITVSGEGEATTVVVGQNLQMTAAVEPANATDPSVSWSVEAGTGAAAIDTNGLLTGTGAGTVTVKATANDGSEVKGSALVTVVEPGPFAGGDGTVENPYQVATAEQLDKVHEYLDKHFIQIADIDLTDYLSVGGDGYNEGKGWVPVGNNSTKFTGTYDGDRFKITGMTFSDPDNGWYTGLFGHTSKDAALRDIILEDAVLSGKHEIGSLVGVNYGTVSDCSSINVDLAGYRNVGGLIGINYGVVQDSYATGEVESTYSYVGGLIGENGSYSGDIYLAESGSVLNCYSSVDVTGDEVVGGLIGNDSYGDIESSYSTGAVVGSDRVGGLVGDASTTNINECYATGSVTGSYGDVGGLVGEAAADTLIQNCFASGNVSGPSYVGGLVGDISLTTIENSHSGGTVTGTKRIGGLVGHSDGEVNRCYSTSGVTGIGGYNEFIGGLVGYNNGLISESYATGDVVSTYLSVGGLVGYNYLGTIDNCYATGDVTGNSRVGGLAGDNRQVITNSYALGSVSGSSDVGGLIGYLTGDYTVSNSCYDTETTGQSDTGKGVPKTTAEMIDQETFTGWEFGTVWTTDTDPASYPYFQWQTDNIPLAELTHVTLGASVMTRPGYPGQYEINAIGYSNSSNAYMNNGTLELLFNDGDINITVTAPVAMPEGTILAADRLAQALNDNAEFNSAYEAINNYSPGYIMVTNKTKEEDKPVTIQFRDPDNTGVIFNVVGGESQPGYAPVAAISTTPVLTGSTVSETIQVKVTQYELDKVVPVTVVAHDSAVMVAERIRAALAADTDISDVLDVSTSGTDIILTQKAGHEVNCSIQIVIIEDV